MFAGCFVEDDFSVGIFWGLCVRGDDDDDGEGEGEGEGDGLGPVSEGGKEGRRVRLLERWI